MMENSSNHDVIVQRAKLACIAEGEKRKRKHSSFITNRNFIVGILLVILFASLAGNANAMNAKDHSSDSVTIGIDLGTTYSAVGIFENGKVNILPNSLGNRVTPSYVGWDSSGQRLIGEAAKNQASLYPDSTVFDAKRLIGRSFDDKVVQLNAKMLPYKIVNNNGRPFIEVRVKDQVKRFAPEEISAMVLGHMKEIAEEHVGHKIVDAVVTVPAYFNDAQRQATKDAGAIAGLNVKRIINEPTAAALAFGIETENPKGADEEKNVLVYDLGGGTFDVSLLTLQDSVFEVRATSGDTNLGGENFDERVMKYMIKRFSKSSGIDISKDDRAISRLRQEVERVKRSLSSQHQARIEIDGLANGVDFSETFTRSRFEQINMELFKKTLGPVKQVLKDASISKSEIDEIVLVGGSTRIPIVRTLLSDFFNGKEVNLRMNPDEAVAYGAAYQGGTLDGKTLDDENDGVIVLDVAPLTLGIETAGGVFTSIINRNSQIPAKKSQVFSTMQDNQQAVRINVFQGERKMVKDQIFLSTFELTGIPPAPRGVPQIEVTFELDVNNILKVSAKDKSTGRQEEVTVTNPKTLTEEEIEQMVKEAEMFAEEDRELKERVESKNNLESFAFRLKNQLKEADHMSDDDKDELERAIEDAIDFLELNGDDVSSVSAQDFKDRFSELEQVAQRTMRATSDDSDSFEDDSDDFDADEFDEL